MRSSKRERPNARLIASVGAQGWSFHRKVWRFVPLPSMTGRRGPAGAASWGHAVTG
ncbi:MAG: hypothetical protein ACYCUF_00850 [Acidimicrobiales bacterium]